MSEEFPRLRICDLLKSVEKLLREYYSEITGSELVLVHVLRAMELIGCSPGRPVIDEKRLIEERGVIIE